MRRPSGWCGRWIPALLAAACLNVCMPGTAAARLQRWLYYSVNLQVNANVPAMLAVLTNAARQGYTHVLLDDFKFSILEYVQPNYFTNISTVRSAAAALGLEIVPAVFPIGYSNGLLFKANYTYSKKTSKKARISWVACSAWKGL